MSGKKKASKLKKALGLRDLVLMNIACVIGLSSLTQAAQFGWSSFIFWILGALFFLVPLGLLVADLNSRMPGEGGFYIWIKSSLGEWHAFIAAWTYWISNVVWFPTVLMTIILSSLYIFGGEHLMLRENFWFTGSVSLIILWVIIIMNIIGLKIGKWIQNIGAISLWILFVLLFISALLYLQSNEMAQPFSVEALLPDFSDFGLIPFFAAIAYSFGGLELSSVMSEEIKNPRRNILKSIYLSGTIITVLYLLGTFSLIAAVPQGGLEIVDGIAQAFHEIDKGIGIPLIGSAGACLVTLGTIGLLGAWMTGSARLPFVIGLDNYLPSALGRIHTKYGTPHISLIVQGIVVTILFLVSIAGAELTDAYSVLYDMSVVLYFIPFFYMFLAFIWHNLRHSGDKNGIGFFENRKSRVWICACLGFSVISLSLILAFIPSGKVQDVSLFYLKVIGGTVLLTAIGLFFFYRKHNNR